MPKIDPDHPQKCGRRKIKLLKYAGKKVIGYKKTASFRKDGSIRYYYIVTLEIGANTRAQSVFGRKCRAASARVIATERLTYDGALHRPILKKSRVTSQSTFGRYHVLQTTGGTTYKVGEIVKPDKYDPCLLECSSGIHFFLEKKQAIEYC